MKIIKTKQIDNCFDNVETKEILFDNIITKDFIFHLKNNSVLQYFPTFSKPFFKIDNKNKFIIKGVEGFNTLRLILKGNPDENYKEFVSLVNNYKNNN